MGEESEIRVEEEAGEGPGLLPTQITESLLTHFWVLTNPHLLTTYAQIVLCSHWRSGAGGDSHPGTLCSVSMLLAYRHAQKYQTRRRSPDKSPEPLFCSLWIITKPQMSTPRSTADEGIKQATVPLLTRRMRQVVGQLQRQLLYGQGWPAGDALLPGARSAHSCQPPNLKPRFRRLV